MFLDLSIIIIKKLQTDCKMSLESNCFVSGACECFERLFFDFFLTVDNPNIYKIGIMLGDYGVNYLD